MTNTLYHDAEMRLNYLIRQIVEIEKELSSSGFQGLQSSPSSLSVLGTQRHAR